MNVMIDLPSGWALSTVGEVVELNPRKPLAHASSVDTLVSFVPMAAVDADLGVIMAPEIRKFGKVRKGYTGFQEGDVLIAKITPCMENGKAAVARNLENGIGFGSTEFHVLRPQIVTAEYACHYVRQPMFRRDAAAHMTGSVGQKRVPSEYLASAPIPVPPINEQRRIVAKIEALFERSRRARQALNAIPPLIDKLRQSILAAAFRGDLTADWRANNPDVEPAQALLQRIRAERRLRWEQDHLDKLKAKGKQPKGDGWKNKYQEPEPVDTSGLPELPAGWCWSNVEELASHIVDCPHSTPKWTAQGIMCVRTTEFRPGKLDLSNVRYVSAATYRERVGRLVPEEGDILYSREGGILGIACLIPPGVKLCMGQRMMLIRAAGAFPSPYLMHYLNSPFIKNIVKSMTAGSASPHLNVRDIKRFSVPVPPHDELLEILRILPASLETIDNLEPVLMEAFDSVRQVESSILAKAFRGELVPQDPQDEPASALLERIRAARQTAPKRGKRPRSTVSNKPAPATKKMQPAPQAPPEPEPEPEPGQQALPLGLEHHDPERIQDILYAALWGRGPLELDAAVRTAADALREQGLVEYKKLRADGSLYAAVKKAVNTAARDGYLDRPKRGLVRAVESNPREYSTDDWRIALLAALDGKPVDREEAIELTANWARENMGLEFKRLRSGGIIEAGIKSAMNSAIRRGELERIDSSRIKRPT